MPRTLSGLRTGEFDTLEVSGQMIHSGDAAAQFGRLNTPFTSRLQNLVEVRFVASALGPQFCLHYNSGLVWLKETWLAGRIAPFALLVVELCPVAYRATAGAGVSH